MWIQSKINVDRAKPEKNRYFRVRKHTAQPRKWSKIHANAHVRLNYLHALPVFDSGDGGLWHPMCRAL